jgi:hypothetical protein
MHTMQGPTVEIKITAINWPMLLLVGLFAMPDV